MKRLLIAALALLVISLPIASRAAALAPTSSFDAGSVHVDQYGKGEPALILIPGLTDGAAVWQSTITKFAPTYRIYALTLPGFGGRTPIAAPMLDTVAADIAAFLPKAGKPILIGHSMGGFLTIRLAEEHSNLIRGAVSVDGLPVLAGMDKMNAEQRASATKPMVEGMSKATPEQFAQSFKNFIGYMTKSQNVDAVTALSQGANPAASGRYLQELASADLRPQLSKITVPLLELAPFDPTLDPYNPSSPTKSAAEKQQYYSQLIAPDPSAKVVLINDSRHFIMYDQPDAFFTAIQNFIKTLP